MIQKIKERIESIRRGEVPEGYKRTKAGFMPADWVMTKSYQAKDIFYSITNKQHGGKLVVLSSTQEFGIVPRSSVDIDIKYAEDNLVSYKKVECGDFVISLRSFQGGIEYSEYVGIVSPAYTVIKSKIPIENGYYKFYFKTADFIKRLNIGTYGIRDGKQIGFADFGDLVLHYPPLKEQQKIAEILQAQDKVIELKEKLLVQKQQQKKYLMQQLLTGKIRLPGFTGKWRQVALNVFLNERKTYSSKGKEYPHVTLSNEGIYPKSERYDRDHLVRTEDKQYKITHYGDICYNPANLKFGAICINAFGSAIFSPIYVTFEVKNGANLWFLGELMTSKRFISAARKYEEGTVYERMAVKPSDLLLHQVFVPSSEEQTAIAEVLSTADAEIQLLKKDIEQEKLKKKSLMQLLLTGIVRV